MMQLPHYLSCEYYKWYNSGTKEYYCPGSSEKPQNPHKAYYTFSLPKKPKPFKKVSIPISSALSISIKHYLCICPGLPDISACASAMVFKVVRRLPVNTAVCNDVCFVQSYYQMDRVVEQEYPDRHFLNSKENATTRQDIHIADFARKCIQVGHCDKARLLLDYIQDNYSKEGLETLIKYTTIVKVPDNHLEDILLFGLLFDVIHIHPAFAKELLKNCFMDGAENVLQCIRALYSPETVVESVESIFQAIQVLSYKEGYDPSLKASLAAREKLMAFFESSGLTHIQEALKDSFNEPLA